MPLRRQATKTPSGKRRLYLERSGSVTDGEGAITRDNDRSQDNARYQVT
jgi:hypothetical protein